MSKRPPPPNMQSHPLAKRFATSSSGRTTKPTAQDSAAAPTDPKTFHCAFITPELLTLARLPTRYHSPLLSSTSPRVIPDAARILLDAIHGDNDIRRARGEYFLACAIGHASHVTAAQHNTEAALAISPSGQSRNSVSQPTLTPLTIFTRFFLMYPLYLILAFAEVDVHRAIARTELSLLAPCPFCYMRWTTAQDYFRDVLTFPSSPRDFKADADRTSKNSILKYLLSNKQLLLHCDQAELAPTHSTNARNIFAAYHRLFQATLEQIRSTYATDFIPWLDDPLNDDELAFLRAQTQDETYQPDLITRHPDAPPSTHTPEPPQTQDMQNVD